MLGRAVEGMGTTEHGADSKAIIIGRNLELRK